MRASSHIFREYDIRGVVGEDLSAETVRLVGRAYGTHLQETGKEGTADDRTVPIGPVVVGQDNRPSSPELAEALIEGLTSTGVDVLSLGVVPTPVTYWAEPALGAEGGIQITGSHNPPAWNGIKLTLRGRPFYGAALQGLRERVLGNAFATGSGARREAPVLDRYILDLAGRFPDPIGVKAVVDCGNGTASVVAVELLERVGVEVVPLFCESDGTFPNHHPDPSVDENLRELVRVVRAEKADLGIAFDGDADRLGAVDEQGRIIRGDVLLLLFGLDLLRRHGPEALLLYDVKCSQVVPEVYEAAGGRSLMWKTGHSLMKEKMRETGALLAGELSGHLCFADEFIGTDDALYAACRLARLVASSEGPLSAMTDGFPRYVSTPEIRIEVTEEAKTRIVHEAVAHFGRTRDVVDVDGARILFPDGWALLRASNTQPVLVARYEARTAEGLERLRGEVEPWLASQGIHV